MIATIICCVVAAICALAGAIGIASAVFGAGMLLALRFHF